MSIVADYVERHISKIADPESVADRSKAIGEIIAIVMEFIRLLQECRNRPPATSREEAVTAKRTAKRTYSRGFYSVQIVRKMRNAAQAKNSELTDTEAEEMSLDALDTSRTSSIDELEASIDEAKSA